MGAGDMKLLKLTSLFSKQLHIIINSGYAVDYVGEIIVKTLLRY